MSNLCWARNMFLLCLFRINFLAWKVESMSCLGRWGKRKLQQLLCVSYRPLCSRLYVLPWKWPTLCLGCERCASHPPVLCLGCERCASHPPGFRWLLTHQKRERCPHPEAASYQNTDRVLHYVNPTRPRRLMLLVIGCPNSRLYITVQISPVIYNCSADICCDK